MTERNIDLEPRDFFRFFRNLQRTGILDQPIRIERKPFQYEPGKRYFENIKEEMLTWDMERLAEYVQSLAPVLKKLADEKAWQPVDLEPQDFFRAFRNVQRAGMLERFYEDNYQYEPGKRYFENIKEFLNGCDMEVLAKDMEKLSPAIRLMADDSNWLI